MPFIKGNIPWNKDKQGLQRHTEEWKKKASGRMRGNKHALGHKFSEKAKKKMSEMRKGRKMPKERGITPENIIIRESIEYRLWREAVFARDNWTCQNCRDKGGKLHAHHIKSFAYYPELRFAIDNGQTLCKYCHKLYR